MARERERRGRESLVNHYYTLLICKFKCGLPVLLSLEMLHHDCGTARRRMLIYCLIFPGLEIIIAGSMHWSARNHKKLQAVVLTVPPWVKEVNRNNPKNTTPNYCGGVGVVCKAQPWGLREIFQPATVFLRFASTVCRCSGCTRHINFS